MADGHADVRANLLVAFARDGAADPAPFLLGAAYRFRARQTSDGWRLAALRSTRSGA